MARSSQSDRRPTKKVLRFGSVIQKQCSQFSRTATDCRQVLLNVLNNAVKFTDRGGCVSVRVTSCGGRAQLKVQDTGRGIPAAVLPYVFDQFRQGAPDVSHQGLGLGLSISRAIVEQHGGTISIESAGENQGTTCTIEMPLRGEHGVHVGGQAY